VGGAEKVVTGREIGKRWCGKGERLAWGQMLVIRWRGESDGLRDYTRLRKLRATQKSQLRTRVRVSAGAGHGAVMRSGTAATGGQRRRWAQGKRLRNQRKAEEREQERGDDAAHSYNILDARRLKLLRDSADSWAKEH